MEVFGISIKGTLKPNIKILAIPSVLVSLLFVIVIYALKTGTPQIMNQYEALQETKRLETALEEKALLLQEIRDASLDQGDKTVIALPDKNPLITVLIQIDNLAEEQEVALSKKELAGSARGVAENVKGVPIKFLAESEDLNKILTYLAEIKNLAPVTRVYDVKVSSTQASFYRADVLLTTYYSGYPDKIPSVSEPVQTLTQEEEGIYELVAALKPPDLIRLDPKDPQPREDPFGLELTEIISE